MRKGRILIIGGVSLFGKYITEVLAPNNEILLTYHKTPIIDPVLKKHKSFQLDIVQKDQVVNLLKKSDPNVVIHLAGISNIDHCEKHPAEAYTANVEGTRNICSALTNSKVHLLFLSSNAVFDGSTPPYKETDTPHPVNVYGKNKSEAENIILATDIYSTIIRCTTLFGWPPIGARENDLSFYLKQLKKDHPLYLVNDLFFNPVSTFRASEAVKAIVNKKIRGIFHVAGKNRISRYTFVKSIMYAFQIRRHPPLIPVTHDYFPQLAPRPVHACLATSKMQQLLNVFPLSLAVELKLLKKTAV